MTDCGTPPKTNTPLIPAAVLAAEIEARGMTLDDLATNMGESSGLVSRIISGDEAITPEISIRIEKALGLPAEFWLGLQSTYDLALARAIAIQTQQTTAAADAHQSPTDSRLPENSKESVQVRTLREQLGSSSAHQRLAAVKAADKLKERTVAPEILDVFQSALDWQIKKECAVALGHLKYRDALPELKAAVSNGREHIAVREWAIWAIGELGSTDEEFFLIDLKESPKCPAGLMRVIGGAVKNIRLEPTRVPRKHVQKLLIPPKSKNREVMALVNQLEEIRLAAEDSMAKGERDKKVLELRKQIRAIDEEYLKTYLAWLSKLPDIEKGLDSKYSY